MTQSHVIGKQTLAVQVRSAHNPYQLQQMLSEAYRQTIVPMLERVFDRFGAGVVWHIDRLELDAGRLDPSRPNWSAELSERLEQQLIDKLHHWQKTAPAPANAPLPNWWQKNWAATNVPGQTSQSAERGPGVLVLTQAASHWSLWVYFLRTGQRYSYAPTYLPDWLPDVVDTLATRHDALSQLQRLLRTHPRALERLVKQHEPAFLRTLLDSITATSQESLWQAWLEWRRFLGNVPDVPPASPTNLLTEVSRKPAPFDEPTRLLLEQRFWHEALRLATSAGTYLTAEAVLTYLWQTEVAQPGVAIGWFATLRRQRGTYPTLHRVIQPLAKTMQRIKANVTPTVFLTEPITPVNIPDTSPTPHEVGSHYMTNAGLVLLNPFFKPLFDKLGLLQGRAFADARAQQRAMVLMHYLASGQVQVAEYDLLLPKLLCGWPPDHPTDASLTLTPAETAEADALLQAAVSHWGALGNASPAALRDGFLSRPGKLEPTPNGWHLHVETDVKDILLDRLPFGWSIGFVRLPWMTTLLTVTWR